MKNIISLIVLTLMLSCCDKDDNKGKAPIDQLPPATQVGANKIGCLLDGKVFLPGNTTNSINCFYQLVNGEYYFFVRCQNRDKKNNLISIDIATNDLQISPNTTFQLYEYLKGNASGVYLFNLDENYTTHTYTGELKITKLDMDKNIISGTFWFDVQDTDGVVHQIREGRFDMQFTE